jgi:hypothetical protein
MGFACDPKSPVWPGRVEKPRMDASGIGGISSYRFRTHFRGLKSRRFGLGRKGP